MLWVTNDWLVDEFFNFIFLQFMPTIEENREKKKVCNDCTSTYHQRAAFLPGILRASPAKTTKPALQKKTNSFTLNQQKIFSWGLKNSSLFFLFIFACLHVYLRLPSSCEPAAVWRDSARALAVAAAPCSARPRPGCCDCSPASCVSGHRAPSPAVPANWNLKI